MRYLPLTSIRGPLLAKMAREICDDPSRRVICVHCGGLVPVRPEPAVQMVRCPNCWRRQRVGDGAATVAPARLSPSALEALRRTARWVRSWPSG